MPRKGRQQPAGSQRDGGRTESGATAAKTQFPLRASAAFDAFYQSQRLVPGDAWPEFVGALQRDLPTCFRVPAGQFAGDVRARLRDDHFGLAGLCVAGDGGAEWAAAPPRPVAWLPPGYAWTVNIPRAVVRKSAPCKQFHEWLVRGGSQPMRCWRGPALTPWVPDGRCCRTSLVRSTGRRWTA
jgi:hypothetical protein